MKKGLVIFCLILLTSCVNNNQKILFWEVSEKKLNQIDDEKKANLELISDNYDLLVAEKCVEAEVGVNSYCRLDTNLDDFSSCVLEKDYLFPFNCEKKETYHIKTPQKVKSLYFNSSAANNPDKIDSFIELAKKSEINSITIDVKTVSGYTSFDFPDYEFTGIKPVSNGSIKDIKSLIKKLHENDIYVIARLVIFKDTLLATNRPDLAIKWSNGVDVWSDYKGKKYTDPYSKEVWDYHLDLSKAIYEIGFDEINFDYIRFPTDGYISKTYYPFSNKIIISHGTWGKTKVIDEFSYYINTKLKEYNSEIVVSADVFGLVTNTNLYQIGQNLESFVLNFDYVGPMIYPSHYGAGFNGYKQPDNNPYEIFNYAISKSNQRINKLNEQIDLINTSTGEVSYKISGVLTPSKSLKGLEKIDINKVRPWLQGFSCSWCKGATAYDRTKFRKQIEAMNDLGLNSWWVWSSGSNYYDEWYNEE